MDADDKDRKDTEQDDPVANENHKSNEKSYSTINNVDSDDIDQETSLKLRGDAIGDTLYSQSFVLKTLLKFSNIVWNEQFEEDLCFLWDMTIEKDVCEYLFDINYPTIACSAISMFNENRFVEIVIGTLANVTCAGCEKRMSTEEIEVVLQEFDTDDPLILIQLMRFISACANSSSKILFLNENTMNTICFILNNSTNSDLLMKALEVTAKITADFKLSEEFVNIRLYNAVITAYYTITNDHLQLGDKGTELTSRYMLESIVNICSYIDHFKNEKLLSEIKENFNIFVQETMKLLKYFCQEQNLLPVSEDFIFFVSAFRYILINLNANYLPELFISLTKILYIISNIKEEVLDLFESLSELVLFFISRSSADKLGKDLKRISKHKVKKIVGLLTKNQYKFEYNVDWEEIHKHIE